MKTTNAFKTNRTGCKGTKEWSDFSYNICTGCAHGCLYCYAKAMAGRFNPKVNRPGAWQKQRLNPNQADLGARIGAKGVVMFPTSHDITPEFLPQALTTIRNLARHNDVLVVSKPHLTVVTRLCHELSELTDKLLFRFTIGALDEALCAFWEPGAPPPQERIQALRHAFEAGFRTSVSIEPMLDARQVTCQLVAAVEPFVTDTIWVGKMQRVQTKPNAHIPGFFKALAKIKAQQADTEIVALVGDLKMNPKVRWKDSIKTVMQRHGIQL
jgi:DNA repair photolyase